MIPLLFRLQSQLPDHLELLIGNRISRSDKPSVSSLPSGLQVTERMVRATKISSYGKAYIGNIRGQHTKDITENVYWIPLFLHPQKLVKQILERTKDE